MFFNSKYCTLLLGSTLLSMQVLAREDVGLGGVATNLMGSVNFLSDFVMTACLVIGAAFLFAGIIRYIEHRRSPLMVPISTVIFLLIAGLVLILLPLLALLSEGAVPYTFYK